MTTLSQTDLNDIINLSKTYNFGEVADAFQLTEKQIKQVITRLQLGRPSYRRGRFTLAEQVDMWRQHYTFKRSIEDIAKDYNRSPASVLLSVIRTNREFNQ